MFGGGNNVSASMFPRIGTDVRPTIDDMLDAREADRIRTIRNVEVSNHNVRIFNMHDAEDVKAYVDLIADIMRGVSLKTHMLWVNEKQVLTRDGNQTWYRYLEWSEFTLNETPVKTIGE